MEKSNHNSDEAYNTPGLEKGIQILECMAVNNKALTLHEIKMEVDVSPTSAYRILRTLVRLGYLMYNDTSKKYKLSRKMLSLGFQAIQEQGLLEVVLPGLRKIRDEVKETVCFGVMGEEKGIFIEQVPGTHHFCFVLTPGKLFELHCSAPGKALMAFMPESIRSTYLAKMKYERFNANSIQNEADYLKELENVRACGYALDMEEELYGVVCLGAPIFNYSNTPCGAIWFSGPKDRLPSKKLKEYAEVILSVTKSISFELGYNNGNRLNGVSTKPVATSGIIL
jgi:DNA-binding IclR family transcriptional regulator